MPTRLAAPGVARPVRPLNPYSGRRKRAWETVDAGADVLTLARERTAYTFDNFDHVAVLFSGGKDSTVVFNLALDEARKRGQRLRVVTLDEEAIAIQTEEYIRRCAALPDVDLEWYCLPVKHRNACSRMSPWWYPWAPEDRDLWVRPLPPEAITELAGFATEPPERRLSIPDANGLLFPVEYGTCAAMMGIRAAESLTRHSAVTTGGLHQPWVKHYTTGTTEKGNVYKVYPVYDWQTEDVWRAPAMLEWDYNRAYDAMEMAGINHVAQRVAPPYGEEPALNLWMFAVCFPEVWDRMSERVPGAAAGARYARTELWSFRSRVAKPAGMTWPDYVKRYIEKFPPAERSVIAKRLASEIRNHYHRTSEPISETAPHPTSGMTWDYIFTVASRGDLKSRKAPNRQKVADDPEGTRVRYDEEVAYITAEGRLGELT